MRILLTSVLIIFSGTTNATTYFISSSGNDKNNGSTSFTPWQTITKLNSVMPTINAGDSILFRRGDTFYGTLTITKSGKPNAPIVISSYGKGGRAIISGFVNITDWKFKGNKIWESRFIFSKLSAINVVAIKGVSKAMGRWPNAKGLPSNPYLSDSSWIYKPLSFPTRNMLSDQDSLDASKTNWTGGELVLRPNRWKYQRNRITSHIDSTLTFTFPPGIENSFASNPGNAGYFIQDHLATLDVQDEWYYNTSSKKLFVYSKTKPTDIKVSSVATLCTVSGSYIIIDNLTFHGANQYGITIGNGSNVTIRNCDIKFTFNAIYSGSGYKLDHLSILNNNIKNTNNNAIYLKDIQGYLGRDNFGYNGSVIAGNEILNTGLFAGNGGSEDYDHSGIVLDYPINCIIEYNHIDSLGHSGIMAFGGDSIIIDKNLITNFCFLLDDAGAIYINTNATYRIISNNIVGNGYGSIQGLNSSPYVKRSGYVEPFGIYLDDGGGGGNNVKVINNTVFNVAHSGLVWARSNNTVWRGNTVYGCRIGIYNRGTYFNNPDYRTIIKNNIIVSTKNEIDPLNKEDGVMSFGVSAKGFSPFIDVDSNYYLMPEFPNDLIYWPSEKDRHINISEWRKITGFDRHSNYFASRINAMSNDSVFFYYNAQKVDSIINLPFPMVDARGKKYNKHITLKPYTSVILIADTDKGYENSQ